MSEVLAAMLGSVAGDLYDIEARRQRAGAEEALTVAEFGVPGRLTDISFGVRPGEIFGVFGLIGSGIETLGRALYGALGPLKSGRSILVGQTPTGRIRRPRANAPASASSPPTARRKASSPS